MTDFHDETFGFEVLSAYAQAIMCNTHLQMTREKAIEKVDQKSDQMF